MADDQLTTVLSWLTKDQLVEILCPAALLHPDVLEAVHIAAQPLHGDAMRMIKDTFMLPTHGNTAFWGAHKPWSPNLEPELAQAWMRRNREIQVGARVAFGMNPEETVARALKRAPELLEAWQEFISIRREKVGSLTKEEAVAFFSARVHDPEFDFEVLKTWQDFKMKREEENLAVWTREQLLDFCSAPGGLV